MPIESTPVNRVCNASSFPLWFTNRLFPALLLLWNSVALAQHDPGRDAMRMIAKGEFAAAKERLAKPPRSQNSPIDEAERNFVLAIMDCKEGNPNAAISHLKEAVANGLPVERILAGPRDLFEPLRQNAKFDAWLRQNDRPLLHGPMLTSLSATTAQFWVRTQNESEVTIQISQGGQEPAVTVQPTRTTSMTDFTGVVVATRLEPSTTYRATIVVDGKPTPATSEFTTFPTKGEPASITIGFGGGSGYTPQFNHMWTTLDGESLTAFLTLGDNVYIDDPQHRMTQRYCYSRRQSESLWKTFTSRTPVFSIYDDHDFGVNDCIPGPEIDVPAWKRPVWEVFRQNWNNPGYGGGESQPGCWYDFHIGDVHFVMLDGRYYRDLKGGSMLGPAQKTWLFETLLASEAPIKFLVSCVPWSPGVKPGSKDTWDGFAKEREEIFSFIHENQIDGVLLMAADRHRSDLRRIPRDDGYDFYEMMSSRLTNVHTHSLMENAKGSEFIMGYNKECSFGKVTIDTTKTDPTIQYTIVNIDGDEQGTRTLKRSQLTSK